MSNKNEVLDEFYGLVSDRYTISPEHYKKFNVKRGLRNDDGTGVLVGLTNIGEVHGYVVIDNEKTPAAGKLAYRGIDIRDIVSGCQSAKRFGFEEVCYLILFGSLPTKAELEKFSKLLSESSELPEGFIEDMILKAPSTNIMNKLARSVLVSYSYDNNPDDIAIKNVLRQSIELIARIPAMAVYGYHAKAHYHDHKSLIIHSSKPGLSVAENFLHMLRADSSYTREESEILDLALILHAEHGGGNNSSFTTHVVSSSGTDTYSAISAAIGSLKGPKHGGANAEVMSMMDDIKANVKDWSNESQIAEYLEKIIKKEAFDKKGLIYGMGHAIYTESDPRAILLKEKARELAELKGTIDEFNLYDAIERLTPEIFCKVKGDNKPLCANVDMYSGFVYQTLGIPHELFTPIFTISRMPGWCAHRIEEIISGGRIIRPAYKSVCTKKEYAPLDKR